MKKMDIILTVLLLTVLVFAVTVIVFNALGLQVQDSLIHTFLGMCATELVAMGGIKIFNVKYEDDGKKADDNGNS